jgi:hypothetical protein
MGITGSIVLAADDPAALARFYGALLEVEPQPGLSPSHWRLPWPAGGWLEVYGPCASTGGPPRQESFGAEAWLLDPEGNRLLLRVVPAS